MPPFHRPFWLALALIALPATAHHNPAIFDMPCEPDVAARFVTGV